MKKHFLYIMLFFSLSGFSQIAKYNHFPTMKPLHILDDKQDNISFAYSMRVIESDYEGPLIRLRRASDNAEQDFGWAENDIVDVVAIDAWRGGSNVYLRTWYDQSKENLNAIQTTRNQQPRFFPDASKPYFQGDGVNDYLTVITPNGLQDVTNAGREGSILSIMRPTRRAQHGFGVLTGNNRWSSHSNWSNGSLFFDPGFCCNATNSRSFDNNSNNDVWGNYSFIRTSTNSIIRVDAVEKLNAALTTGRSTSRDNFAIGWAEGDQTTFRATTSFTEFIMYKTNISIPQVQEMESNSITFWGI